jgi:hypothetical protein
MMSNILRDNVPSHPVSDCPGKVPVCPYLPAPQPSLQTRELAEQPSPAQAFYDSHHFPYRPARRKRYQKMDMFLPKFHFQNLDIVRLAYFPNHLFRSFPDLLPIEDLFPILRAPNQMVGCVVDRMTRPPQCHPCTLAYQRARAYADKGDFPVPLITPSERHEFIPRGKPRGTLQRVR